MCFEVGIKAEGSFSNRNLCLSVELIEAKSAHSALTGRFASGDSSDMGGEIWIDLELVDRLAPDGFQKAGGRKGRGRAAPW